MDIHNYKKSLSNRLTTYFNINNNKSSNKEFDLFAYAHLELGRTFISSKDIIDKFNSNEYILVKYFDDLNHDTVDNYISHIKNLLPSLIKPDYYHKSSYVNGVIVCNNTPPKDIIDKIKKFKYEKIYKFYFNGFSELRIFLVSLNDNLVFCNKCGKKYKGVYLPIP